MTTSKPYHGKKEVVTYGRPTIGPRVYLVKGPSGWSESFDRKTSDKALADFLTPLNVIEVIEMFLQHLKLEGAKAVSWSDITGYLGRITSTKPDLIPNPAGVAFWAQAIMYEERREHEQGVN
jgi:hypothetical protein